MQASAFYCRRDAEFLQRFAEVKTFSYLLSARYVWGSRRGAISAVNVPFAPTITLFGSEINAGL